MGGEWWFAFCAKGVNTENPVGWRREQKTQESKILANCATAAKEFSGKAPIRSGYIARSKAVRSAQPTHAGVGCDGCGMYPITGTRFKCLCCKKFDLCGECESESTHDTNHPMTKLKAPLRVTAFQNLLGLQQLIHEWTVLPSTGLPMAAQTYAGTDIYASAYGWYPQYGGCDYAQYSTPPVSHVQTAETSPTNAYAVSDELSAVGHIPAATDHIASDHSVDSHKSEATELQFDVELYQTLLADLRKRHKEKFVMDSDFASDYGYCKWKAVWNTADKIAESNVFAEFKYNCKRHSYACGVWQLLWDPTAHAKDKVMSNVFARCAPMDFKLASIELMKDLVDAFPNHFELYLGDGISGCDDNCDLFYDPEYKQFVSAPRQCEDHSPELFMQLPWP